MQQKMEIKDNLGNYGYLEFEISVENQTFQNRSIIIAAMEFSRMIGILETLGNLPEGYFQAHKLDVLDWAKEFVENSLEDAVLYFEKKLKQKNRDNDK